MASQIQEAVTEPCHTPLQNTVFLYNYTHSLTKQLRLDLIKHNQQYPQIDINEFRKAHDRFLIIDNEVYLIGASIKDLGKKWFGFTLMENTEANEIIRKLQA